MLKVSVAMTVYNGEKYIEKQLDSIRLQHRLPDEVIIVDDLSDDSTMEIIKEYIDKYELGWSLYQNETNLGFKKNFIKALSYVTGDMVLLCDQDDVWFEDKIEATVSLFSDDSVMGASTGFLLIDGEDNNISGETMIEGVYSFIEKKPEKPLTKISLSKIMHRNISPGCTCCYRKNVIDLFLKNADGTLPHDYQLNVISATLNGFVYYNLPLTNYRIHSNNTLGLKPLSQTRLDIAKEKLVLTNIIKGINERGHSAYKLCQNRYDAIEKKSLIKTLKLFFDKDYYVYYSSKERLGDIMYALGR